MLIIFCQFRKIPIKNEEEDEEGHPPGENEETKSEEQSESVWESWKEVLREMGWSFEFEMSHCSLWTCAKCIVPENIQTTLTEGNGSSWVGGGGGVL